MKKSCKRIKGYAVPTIIFGFEVNKTFKTWKAARRFMRSTGITKCSAVFA